MNKKPDEGLSKQEIAERERRVLSHFLSSPPTPHKPIRNRVLAKRQTKKTAKKA